MEDNEDDKQILGRIVQHLEREDAVVQEVISLLYGTLPHWFPSPSLDRARRIIQHFLNDGFNPELIGRFVDNAMTDSLVVPGSVTDISAFYQNAYELAHIRYALSKDEVEALHILAGKDAGIGRDFRNGQARKGRSGAEKRWAGTFSIQPLIDDLALRRDALGDFLHSDELWPELFSMLDEHGCDPVMRDTQTDKPYVIDYIKDEEGNRAPILYTSFKAMLSKAR